MAWRTVSDAASLPSGNVGAKICRDTGPASRFTCFAGTEAGPSTSTTRYWVYHPTAAACVVKDIGSGFMTPIVSAPKRNGSAASCVQSDILFAQLTGERAAVFAEAGDLRPKRRPR